MSAPAQPRGAQGGAAPRRGADRPETPGAAAAGPEQVLPAKPDPYVVARFLDKLWAPPWAPAPELTRARLQAAVRLNYDLFRKYLAFLQRKGFVEAARNARGEEVLRLTPRGREAREEFLRWIRDLLGPGEP